VDAERSVHSWSTSPMWSQSNPRATSTLNENKTTRIVRN
jgi:hypothetical protein